MLLESDLSNIQKYIMNRYNLNCEKKTINTNGDLVLTNTIRIIM